MIPTIPTDPTTIVSIRRLGITSEKRDVVIGASHVACSIKLLPFRIEDHVEGEGIILEPLPLKIPLLSTHVIGEVRNQIHSNELQQFFHNRRLGEHGTFHAPAVRSRESGEIDKDLFPRFLGKQKSSIKVVHPPKVGVKDLALLGGIVWIDHPCLGSDNV